MSCHCICDAVRIPRKIGRKSGLELRTGQLYYNGDLGHGPGISNSRRHDKKKARQETKQPITSALRGQKESHLQKVGVNSKDTGRA